MLKAWSAALQRGDAAEAQALTVPDHDAQRLIPPRAKFEQAQHALLTAAAEKFGRRGIAALQAVGGPVPAPDATADATLEARVAGTSATVTQAGTTLATLKQILGKWRVDPRAKGLDIDRAIATHAALAAACAQTTSDVRASVFPDAATLAATWALRRAETLEKK